MRLDRLREGLLVVIVACMGVACATQADELEPQQPSAIYALPAADDDVRGPLAGRSARKVFHEQVNEAENLFFTDDGRLFVSAAEDIFEISRAADGSFSKTDYFDEDCVVEGIVRRANYLYGVCIWNDLPGSSFLLGGELTERPELQLIAELEAGSIPNGMAVDERGHIYIASSGADQIVRVTLAAPLVVERVDIWADALSIVNGIKLVDGAMYATTLDLNLVSSLLRIPILPDGSAGKPESLYDRAVTLLDDMIVFNDGLIITDFVNGTLIFWDKRRGAYAETAAGTFYGPTSLVQGRPPMFDERQLIVAEKGLYLVRDERNGDLLSSYQLP